MNKEINVKISVEIRNSSQCKQTALPIAVVCYYITTGEESKRTFTFTSPVHLVSTITIFTSV